MRSAFLILLLALGCGGSGDEMDAAPLDTPDAAILDATLDTPTRDVGVDSQVLDGGAGRDGGPDTQDIIDSGIDAGPDRSTLSCEASFFWAGGGGGELVVPAGALGFAVLQQSTVSDTSTVGLRNLLMPSGERALTDWLVPGRTRGVSTGIGYNLVEVPFTDATLTPLEGTWGFTSNVADMGLCVRSTSDGAFHGGVIDINLFLAPGTVTAAYMRGVLDEMFGSIYGPLVGLRLGNVQEFSLPAEYASIDDADALWSLNRAESVGAGPVPAINVFVVDSIFSSRYRGLSPTPGFALRHGTSQSGLVIASTGSMEQDAGVLAHEMGHFAGLYHTGDPGIAEWDPFADTPNCPVATHNADPRDCSDYSNIMFPASLVSTTLSPSQVRTLQGSTIYRGSYSEDAPPEESLLPWAGGDPERQTRRPIPYDDARQRASGLLEVRPERRPQSVLEARLGQPLCAIHGASDADELRRAGPDALSRLRALARDTGAPDRIRGRALALLRFAAESGRNDEASVVALSDELLETATGRRLRVQALEILEDAQVLHRLSPLRRAALIALGDPIVSRRINH